MGGWNEGDHPRDKQGEFTSGGGGSNDKSSGGGSGTGDATSDAAIIGKRFDPQGSGLRGYREQQSGVAAQARVGSKEQARRDNHAAKKEEARKKEDTLRKNQERLAAMNPQDRAAHFQKLLAAAKAKKS